MFRCVRNLFPCVCLFLVFAFLFLGANPTHASENLNASVGIEPSLTLTLPTAALNLNLDPSTTTFGYKDLPISVSTNNKTGYVMTVSTAGNNTDLVNTTDSNIVLETLPTLAGGYTDSTFVVNKWGYKNGLANNYFPFVSGATVLSNAGPTNGDSTTLRFGTKIDYMQPEGTYSTTFNFALVVNPVISYLYNTVANMSKGTQTAADLQTAITVPTSINHFSDTSNSGVYEYNASEFGAATDASNDYKIYYYRGVLENTVGSYGSDGSAVTYPNYVKLGNTCWRILRTTGSGGVKMIYNGSWTGTTCANSTTNAQLGTKIFSVDSNKYYGSALGYTQNGSYNASKLSATYGTMFGTNTSFSVNSTSSGIKTYIEDWYNNTSGIKATYGSHLEADAGYCADRTLNSGTSWTTPMADNATVSTSTVLSTSTDYYTGAYIRNMTTTKNPSLTCSRNNADVYTTSTATTGNKQLSQPIALITADEASFAGSGSSTAADGSSYHANSFLHSGSMFWLLSPSRRDSFGEARAFWLRDGSLINGRVDFAYGVRPAISLSPGAMIASGSGTATDPWTVDW